MQRSPLHSSPKRYSLKDMVEAVLSDEDVTGTCADVTEAGEDVTTGSDAGGPFTPSAGSLEESSVAMPTTTWFILACRDARKSSSSASQMWIAGICGTKRQKGNN